MDTTRVLRPGAATTGAFTPEFRSALPAVWLLATQSATMLKRNRGPCEFCIRLRVRAQPELCRCLFSIGRSRPVKLTITATHILGRKWVAPRPSIRQWSRQFGTPVPKPGRRRALRGRSPDRYDRAQRRRAGGHADSIPRRHSSRRRRGGERRRPDGRRRQSAARLERFCERLSLRAGVLAGRRHKRRGLHEPGLLRGFSRRRAIALQRARRISSSTAQRTSIRFGSYTWNMQGGLLP